MCAGMQARHTYQCRNNGQALDTEPTEPSPGSFSKGKYLGQQCAAIVNNLVKVKEGKQQLK